MAEVTVRIPNNIFTMEEFDRARTDPVFFVTNFCKTYDPRVPPHDLSFELYDFQREYIVWLVEHIEKGKDCFTEKSRDMGVSWMVLSVLLWFWLFKPGSQILVGSRKEDLVDNGTLDSLFGKLDYLIKLLPFKPEEWDRRKCRTYMKLVHPTNKNVIKGESANKEFSRQGRYKAIFFDEGAFWDSIDTAWTAAGDAAECRILVTTPPKQPNFAKYLRNSGKVEVKSLHWRLHPLKDEDWYAKQRERRTSEEIAQELDINWEGAITGRVYPEVDRVRVAEFPYRPDWPLYVSHDFGHHPDPHSIGWFQVNPSNGRTRLIETFERNDRIIDWYAPLFGHPINSNFPYTSEEIAFISLVGEWKRASHFGDPAGRAGNEVSGKSVIDRLAELQIYVQTNSKANDLESRKTETKHVLMQLDVNDTVNNRYFMECLRNARYPDRGPNSQSTVENVKPIHDWTSHMRTMLEYFAVNYVYSKEEYEPAGLTANRVLKRLQNKNQRNRY